MLTENDTIYIKDTVMYGKSIFAKQSFSKGETIFTVCGPITKIPSIYTIPIDFNLYIDPIGLGKFLNHSCDPSCGIQNRTKIVTMRNLNKDDEITIDYAMIVSEYDDAKLKQKIICNCGSKICRGKFGSFKFLPDNLKEKYRGYISDYLLQPIKNIDFKIVDKNEEIKRSVMNLLHEYPQNFIHGLFEQYAEQDFANSDIAIAYNKNTVVGCLMFNRTTNEFKWLAVKKDIGFSKSEIAKQLFESFYSTIDNGTEVHLFVNTEDAQMADYPNFSGKNFEPARRLYKTMGLELKEENRVENKYGQGAHAYKVSWIPNKK